MVLDKRLPVGVKDAVVPEYVTVPGTDVVPCFKVKFVAGVISVDGFIGTLKVAVTILLRTMLVPRSNGSVEITVGAVRVPVVNVHA